MSDAPATSSSRTRVGSGGGHVYEHRHKLPVVFVPGIMGSRLRIRVGSDVIPWEPDSPTSIAWNYGTRRSATVRRRLNPANRSTFPQDVPGVSGYQLIHAAPDAEREAHLAEIRQIGSESRSAHHAARRMERVTNEFERQQRERLRQKGWNEVAWDFYGSLLFELETYRFRGGSCPAYAVGYDWRKTNADSARRLHQRIGEICEREHADKVVVVTHSMGGLVTRSCLNQFGEDRIFAVIHITQPAYGAPVLYRRFKTGGVYFGSGNDGVMAILFGGTPAKTATVLGVIDGGLELLPTTHYRIGTTRHSQFPEWISWSSNLATSQGAAQPPANVFDMYRESSGRLGIIPPDFRHAADLSARLRRAESFAASIDSLYHSQTYWICSRGNTTDVAVRIEPLEYEQVTEYVRFGGDVMGVQRRRIRRYAGAHGTRAHDFENVGIRVIHYFPDGESDGTVPRDSQHGYRMRPGSYPERGVFEVAGAVHDAACGDARIMRQVISWVQSLVREYARSRHSP